MFASTYLIAIIGTDGHRIFTLVIVLLLLFGVLGTGFSTKIVGY